MNNHEELLAKKRAVERDLLRLPGVHAVGLGRKLVNDRPSADIAIRVYVRRKRKDADLPPGERISREMLGVKTDVIEGPPLGPMADNASYRPLIGGAKIEAVDVSPGQQTGGTLGCFALTTEQPSRAVALTNQHVVIATNGQFGNKVGQPNTVDCGECCTSIIGTVLNAVLTRTVDAASILLLQQSPEVGWDAEILDLKVSAETHELEPGPVTGTHTVTDAEAHAFTPEGAVGYPVWKRGQVTGLTRGLVTDVNLTGQRDDGWEYEDQLLIKPDPIGGGPLAEEGDSGSALVNAVGEVVGLVWGSQGGETWVPLLLPQWKSRSKSRSP